MDMTRHRRPAAIAFLSMLAGAPALAQPAAPAFDGAIGALVTYGAEYPGAEKSGVGIKPAFYLRYGRVSLSNASGFVVRRSEDVFPGLGIDLLRDERLHLKLTLRYDRGRNDTGSAALAGMGDIDQTVRVRMSGSWQIDKNLRFGASWNVDALGKGGGNVVDVGLSRDHPLSPVMVWSWGGGVTFAGDRHMQSYFGVSNEQAARTNYPVYSPGGGLRDVTLSTSVRTEFGDHWSAVIGGGVTRLMGPAADSPLTKRPTNWGLNVGLARRF